MEKQKKITKKKTPKQTNKLNNDKKRKQSKKKTKQKQIWSKLYVKVTMGINKKKLIGHLKFGTYFLKTIKSLMGSMLNYYVS